MIKNTTLERLTRGLLGLAAVTLGIALAAPAAQAENTWGPSNDPYHWERAGNNVSAAPSRLVTVGNNHFVCTGRGKNKVCTEVDEPSNSLLGDVVDDWNASGGSDLDVAEVDGGSGDVESYNDEYGFRPWIGLASIEIDANNHIQSGETKLNDSYLDVSLFNDAGRQLVLCQEIGHIFGLDHNRFDNDTCMNDETDLQNWPATAAATTPNAHDGDTLGDITVYGHVHESTDPEPRTCNPKSPKCDAFGFGPGAASRNLTFVTWVERFDSVSEMFDAADLVVDATVLSSGFDRMIGRADRAVPITVVTLRVTETYGGFSAPVITLEQTRGPSVEIVDNPGYVQGDSYTLYLREIGANTYQIMHPDGRILQ